MTPPPELFSPSIRLDGEVDNAMFRSFRDALAAAMQNDAPIVLEISTLGGDADVGRRIATDIGLARRQGRRLLFFGKTNVYSAGVSIMAAFPAEDRWLSADCALLIHCRRLNKTLTFDGPLAGEKKVVQALLSEIEVSQQLERQGFGALIAGSDVPLDELYEKASTNWYLTADQALGRRLIAGIV